jgi:hypothetical protein
VSFGVTGSIGLKAQIVSSGRSIIQVITDREGAFGFNSFGETRNEK